MRGLGVTSLISGGAVGGTGFSFDPINKTGGSFSNNNTLVTATGMGDRHFALPATETLSYVEIRWNGVTAANNHSYGVARMAAGGPFWAGSYFVAPAGFLQMTGVPQVIGLKRSGSVLTVWRDATQIGTYTISDISQPLYFACSLNSGASHELINPSAWLYPARLS